MFIGKVVGSVIATQKAAAMTGSKLLIVEPYRLNAEKNGLLSTDRSLVVVDTLGAGENEFVLVVQGSSARLTPETKPLPIDAAIIGIIDAVHIGKKSFSPT